jgi:hypothetical protein
MKSINDMISDLSGIRGAIGQEFTDPRQRPRRRPLPAPERVSGDPIFEAGAWALRDPGLWEEEKARARRAVEGLGAGPSDQSGIEALAWYVSFHDDQQGWGIYIPLSSIGLIDELYLKGLRRPRDRRLQLAWLICEPFRHLHDCSGLLPAEAFGRVGLAPTGKRRLVTAHT